MLDALQNDIVRKLLDASTINILEAYVALHLLSETVDENHVLDTYNIFLRRELL